MIMGVVVVVMFLFAPATVWVGGVRGRALVVFVDFIEDVACSENLEAAEDDHVG